VITKIVVFKYNLPTLR